VSRCQHLKYDRSRLPARLMWRSFRVSRCQHYECVLIYSKFEDSGIPENYDAERLSGEQVLARCPKVKISRRREMRRGFRASASAQRCSEYTFAK